MNHFVFLSSIVLLCSGIVSAQSNEEIVRSYNVGQWLNIFSQGIAMLGDKTTPVNELIEKTRSLKKEAENLSSQLFIEPDFHIGFFNNVLAKPYLVKTKDPLVSNQDACVSNGYARALLTESMQLLRMYLDSPKGLADSDMQRTYNSAEKDLFSCLIYDYSCVPVSAQTVVVKQLQSIYSSEIIVDSIQKMHYKDILTRENLIDELFEAHSPVDNLSQAQPQAESQPSPIAEIPLETPPVKKRSLKAWPLIGGVVVAGLVVCGVVILKKDNKKNNNSNKDEPVYENVGITIP